MWSRELFHAAIISLSYSDNGKSRTEMLKSGKTNEISLVCLGDHSGDHHNPTVWTYKN